MCGIAGYFSKKPIAINKKNQTLDLMNRRGPDHQKYTDFIYNDKFYISLFHSRLSIIDLSTDAQQPFKVGKKHFTFNGEIYNFLEIRKELEQKGLNFYTKSDTEVLARAINYWGYDALDRFEGMWAFAVFDEEDGSLSLCRDRFGEKPLYYYEDVDSNIYFGSEIKYITQMLGKKFSINTNYIKNFLVNGYKSLNKLDGYFFNDIKQVKAGSIKKIKPNQLYEEYQYWTPNYNVKEMSIDASIKNTRDKLIEAVKLRLRSDVPLGFCMSGGVDSNSIIAIAKRLFNYNVEGFTIVNTDERYEEKSVVDHVIKTLKIDHTEVYLEKDNFLDNLKSLIKHHDSPVYTITYYAHWLLLSEFKKKGYKISLSGTGADELFSGYYDHHNMYFASIFNNQDRYKQAVKEWQEYIGKIVRNPYLKDPNIFVNNVFERGHITLGKEDFSNYFINPSNYCFNEDFYTPRILRNRMLNEIFTETVPVILHEDDANAMYYSIENRSPFLDRNLFEFAASIPDEYLVQKGMAKYILREAMRGIVPDMVLDQKKKIGFNAPLEHLINTKDPLILNELLSDSPIWDILDKKIIAKQLTKNNLTNSMSKFLFSFISTKIFLEEYS